VTNYTGLEQGSTIDLRQFYSLAQLLDAFPDLNHLNWSVTGGVYTSLPGYPYATVWVTVPRPTFPPVPSRLNLSAQQITVSYTAAILDGAVTASAISGISNQDNTLTLVREDINTDYNLSHFVAAKFDTTASTLSDSWPKNVETVTPANFTNAVIADFYEVRPIGSVDPHTGETNGPGYLVGYFTFNTNGTMTFTRSSTNSPPPPPPAPVLSVSLTGNGVSILFPTTNGAIYTLFYTNSSGFTAPVTAWKSFPTTVTGDGSVKSFADTTSNVDRVYRVGAH
jgi:hypothetical protein